jgi:hypothetical protein
MRRDDENATNDELDCFSIIDSSCQSQSSTHSKSTAGRRHIWSLKVGDELKLTHSANNEHLTSLEQDVLWEYAKLGDKIRRVSYRPHLLCVAK